MQSYQLVKREGIVSLVLSFFNLFIDLSDKEILRRMFSRWLTATKKIRYRRAMLQEREEEMKLALTERAWDRWRERSQEERLRPLVRYPLKHIEVLLTRNCRNSHSLSSYKKAVYTKHI